MKISLTFENWAASVLKTKEKKQLKVSAFSLEYKENDDRLNDVTKSYYH